MRKNKKTENNGGEKVRRFPKFQILDVVIILLIIAMLVGIYFRYNVFEMFGDFQNQNDAQLTFTVTNIKDSTRHYINIDDVVYFKSDGKVLGSIMESADNSDIALNFKPASETFIKDSGEIITVNYPSNTRINADGKIKCKGTFSDDGTFLLDGATYLSAGQSVLVCTEKVTLQIVITGIEKIDS